MTIDQSTNRRAIGFMALAVCALATNDAVMRWVGADISVGQMITVRGLFLSAVLLMGARISAALWSTPRIAVRDLLHRWSIARAVCELGATYLFLSSLNLIPIATATTLVFTSPILLTALSGPLFGERVGPWRWAAVLAGFGGVLLITAPGTALWESAMLLPLGAALMMTLRDVSTRMVPPSVPSVSVTLTTAIVVCIGGLASLPWGWTAMSLGQVGWMALAGTIIAVSFFSFVVAIRIGELSLVAPVQYLIIVCAAGYGWLDEVPGPNALIGGAIVVGSGLLIVYRERVNRQRQTAAEEAAQ